MAASEITAEEDAEQAAPKPKRSGPKWIIVTAVLVLLLGGGGAAAFMFYPQVLSLLTGAEASAPKEAAKSGAKVKNPPIYVELGDAFVVNFTDGNRTRYLQVRIEAMTRESEVSAAITTHLPRIRNNLVFLLSAVDAQTINTVAGKEELRDQALKEVQGVLKDETGKPGIEAIYFTSFVVQ